MIKLLSLITISELYSLAVQRKTFVKFSVNGHKLRIRASGKRILVIDCKINRRFAGSLDDLKAVGVDDLVQFIQTYGVKNEINKEK